MGHITLARCSTLWEEQSLHPQPLLPQREKRSLDSRSFSRSGQGIEGEGYKPDMLPTQND